VHNPKIGIVSTDWSQTLVDSRHHPIPGGAGWIRLQQIRPHLPFETITGSLLFNEKKGFSIMDFDGRVHMNCGIIVLQRLMFGDLVEKIDFVKRMKVRPLIINDLDDWYWGLSPDNAAYSLVQPTLNPNENIDHYEQILRMSDVITVSTPFLYNKMRNWLKHPNVVLVENGVSVAHFKRRAVRTRKPVVGWVGSTSHRSRDLEELSGLFGKGDLLHHSGHNHGAPLFQERINSNGAKVTLSPMYPPREYARKAFDFDIGIAPLSDSDFNKAKSWIKVIEYAAAGIPAVASAAPEYVRLRDEYGIGRIATSLSEWREHLDDLADVGVRKAERDEVLERVAEVDVTKMARRWQELIAGLSL